MICLAKNFQNIQKNNKKAYWKTIWIFINALLKDFYLKMKPLNSLFYSYLRIGNLMEELFETLMKLVKILLDFGSQKILSFFTKWMKCNSKNNDDELITHFIINSQFLENFLKFCMMKLSQINENNINIQQAQKLLNQSSLPSTNTQDDNYLKMKLNEMERNRPIYQSIINRLEQENQLNHSRGSINYYFCFYFPDSINLMFQSRRSNSEDLEPELKKFLNSLCEKTHIMPIFQNSTIDQSNMFMKEESGMMLNKNFQYSQNYDSFNFQFSSRNLATSYFMNISNKNISQKDDKVRQFLESGEKTNLIKAILTNIHVIFESLKYQRKKFINIISISNALTNQSSSS